MMLITNVYVWCMSSIGIVFCGAVISFIGHHLQIACFRIVLSSNEVTEMDSWTCVPSFWFSCQLCSIHTLLSFFPSYPDMNDIWCSESLITLETLFTLGVCPKTNCHYLLAMMSFQTLFDWLDFFFATHYKIFSRIYWSHLSIQL